LFGDPKKSVHPAVNERPRRALSSRDGAGDVSPEAHSRTPSNEDTHVATVLGDVLQRAGFYHEIMGRELCEQN